MTRVQRTSTPMSLPSLDRIFAALGDQSRLAIVHLLLDGHLRTAGDIAEHLSLPMSTCSYHLSKLLSSGVTVCKADGAYRFPVLRREELNEAFPGLLDLIARFGIPSS